MMLLLVSCIHSYNGMLFDLYSLAHQAAVTAGILHQDLSPGNIIIVGGRGFLIDWDFAKHTCTTSRRRITRTVCDSFLRVYFLMNRQGTWQFMSANLIEDASAVHTYQDDLESSFWVLLWTAIMFTRSSLSKDGLSKFIREAFELGGEMKQSVLLSQTILKFPGSRSDFSNDPRVQPPLFPDCCQLYLLLKDLADLFRTRYWQPHPADWQSLMTVEALMVTQGDIIKDVIKTLPAYHYQQYQAKLQDHHYAIECFARHLKGNDWPQNDKAVAQDLSEVVLCEMQGKNTVNVLQSKHILECVEEEEEEHRAKVPRQSQGKKVARPRSSRRKKASSRR